MVPESPDEPGRVMAVSVGLPREVEWRGETLCTGIFKSPVAGPVEVGLTGLAGDGQADLSVHGGIDKAVYAYDRSSVEHWRRELGRPDLEPGGFGENLTLRGAPEERVRIGDRFRIGGSLLEVSQPRQPCMKLGLRFQDPGFPKRFFKSGRVGYYLRVVTPGPIAAGDPITHMASAAPSIDVRSLVAIWLDRSASRADLERAIASPALADAWRVPLEERLARHPG